MRSSTLTITNKPEAEIRHPPKEFPFIAEGYIGSQSRVSISITRETLYLPEATEFAAVLYEHMRVYLERVLAEEEAVRNRNTE
jgi:hypothetical protein